MQQWNVKIRELREDREPKTTQTDIAKMLGTTQQYYSEYETGKRKLPIDQLIKLCNFYHVSADYILGFDEQLPFPKR